MRFHVCFLPKGIVEDKALVEKAAVSAQLNPANLTYRGNGIWELPGETVEHIEKLDPITASVIGRSGGNVILFEDAVQWLERREERGE